MRSGWNHNIQYHDVVLRSAPPTCLDALDVGCGEGLLARQLATRCQRVTAIDLDHQVLLRIRASQPSDARITFLEGDVMTYPFSDSSFDLIAATATLHHLPLRPGIERLRALLKPRGVLVIIGLYRRHTIRDYVYAAAGLPASWLLRRLHSYAEVQAPLQEPRETLEEICAACNELLPGNEFRRHLLFRYSVVWQKP
ncbi:MAG: class I SAM-dependent methyltransferase [Terracidiphilus sp.]|jgi:SAM-dependent methyltransferase